jgi:hypothetical protein
LIDKLLTLTLTLKIKVEYLDRKNLVSDKLWYAANAAYTKLTKYYCKINSSSYAIATVLDPRYKLAVYETTQDSVALRESAKLAITSAFERYSQKHSVMSQPEDTNITSGQPTKKRRMGPFAASQNELTTYLHEHVFGEELDPLNYWRENKLRFPILARMARDYLALQPTSKDVEGNFSKGRRTIPYYRRSQNASSIRNQMLVNSGYNLGIF